MCNHLQYFEPGSPPVGKIGLIEAEIAPYYADLLEDLQRHVYISTEAEALVRKNIPKKIILPSYPEQKLKLHSLSVAALMGLDFACARFVEYGAILEKVQTDMKWSECEMHEPPCFRNWYRDQPKNDPMRLFVMEPHSGVRPRIFAIHSLAGVHHLEAPEVTKKTKISLATYVYVRCA